MALELKYDESSYRIWEVREKMPSWGREKFDTLLRRMSNDKIIYFVEYSDINHLSKREISGSMPGPGNLLYFYIVKR